MMVDKDTFESRVNPCLLSSDNKTKIQLTDELGDGEN